MTDSDGQGIGDVQRGRHRIHSKEQGHHLLHLGLLRPAVSDDGALHLRGRVLRDRDPGLRCCEHQHTPNVPELQGALDVLGVEEIFDGNGLWLVACQQVGQPAMDRTKFLRKGRAARRRERSTVDDPVAAAARLYAAKSGALGTGVNPENSHASNASISFASISKLDQTC